MTPDEKNLLTAVKASQLATVTKLAGSANINKSTLQDEETLNPVLCLALELVDNSKPATVKIAEKLIIKGYPVDLPNDDGDTPLHIAVRGGHTSLAELLIKKDADIHVANELGETPIKLAIDSNIPLEEIYQKEQASRQEAARAQQRLQSQTPTVPPKKNPAVSTQPRPQPRTPFGSPKALPKTPPRTTPQIPAAQQKAANNPPRPSSASSAAPEKAKDLHYYQDKLLKIKYAETMNELSKAFFQEAIRQIRQNLGVDYLAATQEAGKLTQYRPSIFISYAQEDLSREWIAHNLHKHLTKNLNCHVYFDQSNMTPGTSFQGFEKAIYNATCVLVIATPLYKAKYDAFKKHGKDKARSGVSDEMEMIDDILNKNPDYRRIIPVVLPGRVPDIDVNQQTGKVWISVKPASDIQFGYEFIPATLSGLFGSNFADGTNRKNTNYYLDSFHLIKTLYQIPQSRYLELKQHKKLFLKTQERIFSQSMPELEKFKARIEDEKQQWDKAVDQRLSEELEIPTPEEVKDKKVFEKYADSEQERQQEALLSAIQEGQTFMITVSKVKKTVDFSWKDPLGDTFLHYTAALGNMEATEALYKAGVNQEAQNDEGNTPLIEAASQGQLATVLGLLAHGANASHRNHENQTAFDSVISQSAGVTPSNTPKASAQQTAYQKTLEQAALALIQAEAHQEQKPPEVLLQEKVQASTGGNSDQTQQTKTAQLKALQQRLTKTRALVLSGKREDLGELHFGLYQSRTDADSALRCLISEDETRYGKTEEAFKREVLIKELKQAINSHTPQGKAIQQHLIREMNQRHKALKGGVWQPEPAFPAALKQQTGPTPDFAQHVEAYLDYIATPDGRENVYLMAGGFLDAVAELKQLRVCYWQEKAGSLTCIHEFRPQQAVSAMIHILHQGVYFDVLTPQAQAGIVVNPVDETFPPLTLAKTSLPEDQEWLLQLSYLRWQKTQTSLNKSDSSTQSVDRSMLGRLESLLLLESCALHWAGEVSQNPTSETPSAGRDSERTDETRTANTAQTGKNSAATSSATFFKPALSPLEAIKQKAKSVADKVTAQEVSAVLDAVGRGQLETVKKLLQANPHLRHATGKMTDVRDKSYVDITVLQYAFIASDIGMCKMILEQFRDDEKADIANQINADVIKQHGGVFTLEPTIKAYQELETNWYRWDGKQRQQHWCTVIGGYQKNFPMWLRYEMTQPGGDAPWCKKTVTGEPKYRYDTVFGIEQRNSWEGGYGNRYYLGMEKVKHIRRPFPRRDKTVVYPSFAWVRWTAEWVDYELRHLSEAFHDREILDIEQSKILGYQETLQTRFCTFSHDSREITSQP